MRRGPGLGQLNIYLFILGVGKRVRVGWDWYYIMVIDRSRAIAPDLRTSGVLI